MKKQKNSVWDIVDDIHAYLEKHGTVTVPSRKKHKKTKPCKRKTSVRRHTSHKADTRKRRTLA